RRWAGVLRCDRGLRAGQGQGGRLNARAASRAKFLRPSLYSFPRLSSAGSARRDGFPFYPARSTFSLCKDLRVSQRSKSATVCILARPMHAWLDALAARLAERGRKIGNEEETCHAMDQARRRPSRAPCT